MVIGEPLRRCTADSLGQFRGKLEKQVNFQAFDGALITPHRISHPIPRQFIKNGANSFDGDRYRHAYSVQGNAPVFPIHLTNYVGYASCKFGDCICTDFFSSSSGRALMIDIMGSTGYLNG